MAINFENVIGNQTSANVLAQINNNFAKINSTPVPKADFATNADTVDNKHASELIPGAATFLDNIASLANLNRSLPGADHKASLEPKAMRDLIKIMRLIDEMKNTGKTKNTQGKVPYESELFAKRKLRGD